MILFYSANAVGAHRPWHCGNCLAAKTGDGLESATGGYTPTPSLPGPHADRPGRSQEARTSAGVTPVPGHAHAGKHGQHSGRAGQPVNGQHHGPAGQRPGPAPRQRPAMPRTQTSLLRLRPHRPQSPGPVSLFLAGREGRPGAHPLVWSPRSGRTRFSRLGRQGALTLGWGIDPRL